MGWGTRRPAPCPGAFRSRQPTSFILLGKGGSLKRFSVANATRGLTRLDPDPDSTPVRFPIDASVKKKGLKLTPPEPRELLLEVQTCAAARYSTRQVWTRRYRWPEESGGGASFQMMTDVPDVELLFNLHFWHLPSPDKSIPDRVKLRNTLTCLFSPFLVALKF